MVCVKPFNSWSEPDDTSGICADELKCQSNAIGTSKKGIFIMMSFGQSSPANLQVNSTKTTTFLAMLKTWFCCPTLCRVFYKPFHLAITNADRRFSKKQLYTWFRKEISKTGFIIMVGKLACAIRWPVLPLQRQLSGGCIVS